MALITVKNPELYRDWIAYLCKRDGCEDSFGNSYIRTEAFFNSQSGKSIPVY